MSVDTEVRRKMGFLGKKRKERKEYGHTFDNSLYFFSSFQMMQIRPEFLFVPKRQTLLKHCCSKMYL